MQLHARAPEHLDDARGRARHERGQAQHQTAGVDRMEAVDVLVRVHRGDDLVFHRRIGERQLDQDAVDGVLGVQRRHGVKAPQLTTDEFLRLAQENPAFPPEAVEHLKRFLESADLVKFAGLEATTEMSAEATSRARDYINANQ